jgi:putative DNA primase/helicase
LLIDEADASLRGNEELRGIINSGHTRESAYVLRTVGDEHQPTRFNTFCPKAIAGIGRQAATIEDRSIIIQLQRKTPDEKIVRLRHIEPEIFNDLRARLARFAQDYGEAIEHAKIKNLPDALNDREQDNWEPLFAIADLAGPEWLAIATDAALALSGADTTQSRSVELLIDIQRIFQAKRGKSLFTEALISELCSDPEKPWAAYGKTGKPITARQVARLLKDFGVKSQTIREGENTGKGYLLTAFCDAFNRYIFSGGAGSGISSVTTSQTNENNDLGHFSCRHKEDNVTDKKEANSANLFSCDVVTDRNSKSATQEQCDGKAQHFFNLEQETIVEVIR